MTNTLRTIAQAVNFVYVNVHFTRVKLLLLKRAFYDYKFASSAKGAFDDFRMF